MDKKLFDLPGLDVAWCPGCGNFGILSALKAALAELDIPPGRLVLVSGIGQAAKAPQYLACNYFNGLHGRALPPATAIKAVRPELTVIVTSGDGCSYGEGGNHFIHAVRRNPDLTLIVHDNMVYGLTKGQASPTSREGFVTPVQTGGVFEPPFDPLAVAIALDAPFVARAFSAELERTKDILKRAITHKGFSLVDILQPCVSFNKVNTYQWFKEHTYPIEEGHDPRDRQAALRKAFERDKLALGVLYENPGRKTFEEQLAVYAGDGRPLGLRADDRRDKLARLLESYLVEGPG
jgi:2-oxoglutarate ferredoxin oxidoreductase subunit beta